VICANRQLAAIIAAHPQTLDQLGDIEEFGKAKLERYGADVLAVFGRGAGWQEGNRRRTLTFVYQQSGRRG
jgi:hypothetical protein